MKASGYIMLVAGAVVALLSFLMQTSVPTGSGALLGTAAIGDVLNLGLLQRQELVFIGGTALFVAGAVLAGAGAIVEELRGTTAPGAGTVGHTSIAADVPAFSRPTGSVEEVASNKEKDLVVYVALGVVGVVLAVLVLISL